jgi:hypothetical protein
MNRTSLVRKIWISISQRFLEGRNTIRNKGFWHISKPFQINQKPPVPQFSFPAFLEKKVDGLFEPPIPGHKAGEQFSLNPNPFPIQYQNTITFFEMVFGAREEHLSFRKRSLYATKGCGTMDMPALA